MSTAENGGPAGTSTLGGRARRAPGLVPVTETLRTTDRTTHGPDGAGGAAEAAAGAGETTAEAPAPTGIAPRGAAPTGAAGTEAAASGAAASNAAPTGTTSGGEGREAERGAGRATAVTGAAGAGRGAMAFWRLLGSELGLTFRRPRNLVILAVLAVVPVVIGVTLRVVGGGDEDIGGIVQDVAGNSLMLTFLSFSFLTLLLMPVAVSVVAGDAIAGEAGAGTLRYLLAAPAGRTRLLVVKFLNAAVYSYAVTAVVALSALVTGLLLFPAGPVTLLSGTTIGMAEGLLRIAISVGYVGAGMAALAAVALALSVFTEVSIGAIAGTMVLIIVCQVLRAIPELDAVAPYLLPTRFTDFDAVLRSPIDVAALRDGLLAFGAYILLFGSIAWARFSGKDITS